MLKEYLVRYNINKRDYFGVAVVVASSMQNAIDVLKAQGAYNGTPNSYLILEVALINDTNQYNAACILEEIFTTNGDSAYELAVKHGYKGTETQWLESLKGEKGDKGDPGISAIPIEVTYEELKNLRDNSKLHPGNEYRITDFVTTTTEDDSYSSMNPFDIIVTALDSNKLSADAKIVGRKGNNAYSKYPIESWKIKYTIDPYNQGDNNYLWSKPISVNNVLVSAWGRLEYDSSISVYGETYHLYAPKDRKTFLQNYTFSAVPKEDIIIVIDTPPSEEDFYPSLIFIEKSTEQELGQYLDLSYSEKVGDNEYHLYYYNDNGDEVGFSYVEGNEIEINGTTYYQVNALDEDVSDDWYEEGSFMGTPISSSEYANLYYGFKVKPSTYELITPKVIHKSNKCFCQSYDWWPSYHKCIYQDYTYKGVIYYMEDHKGNKCPYDFTNIWVLCPNVFGIDTARPQANTTFYQTFNNYNKSFNNIFRIKKSTAGTASLNRLILFDESYQNDFGMAENVAFETGCVYNTFHRVRNSYFGSTCTYNYIKYMYNCAFGTGFQHNYIQQANSVNYLKSDGNLQAGFIQNRLHKVTYVNIYNPGTAATDQGIINTDFGSIVGTANSPINITLQSENVNTEGNNYGFIRKNSDGVYEKIHVNNLSLIKKTDEEN